MHVLPEGGHDLHLQSATSAELNALVDGFLDEPDDAHLRSREHTAMPRGS